jgi:hypothetical protein
MKHLLVCLMLCVGIVSSESHAEELPWRVGVAVVDITPPVGWRRAGGYTEVISTGVHDPLVAKALVISQGDTHCAIVSNDLCSVPLELTAKARLQASQATGIPVEHIVIVATHTHGGPEYYGPLRDVLHARALQQQGRDPQEPIDYQAQLVERWVDVTRRARAAQRDATLSVVVPHQLGLAFNRRYLMKDGSTGWIPDKLNPQIFRPLGPTDPELPFVLARETKTDKPFAALTVFAMHTAIYGDPPFGACYPGYLQSRLRSVLDAPGLISLFGEGCAGDVNHIDVSSGDPQTGAAYSDQVATSLAQTIQNALPFSRPIATELAIRSTVVHAPVVKISEDEYRRAKAILESLDQNQADFLVVVDAWRKMFCHTFWEKYNGQLPQEVQAIRLDSDTAIVALPHEVFTELGLAIKSGSPFRTTIVLSLANDLDFYIPTMRAFEEGHYEPTSCPLVPGCGERLVETAVTLLQDLKALSDDSASAITLQKSDPK